jgi:hypothetical protein
MRSSAIPFTLVFALLASGIGVAQSKQRNPVLARLSYRNAFFEDRSQQSPRICFSVYENGMYLLSRSKIATGSPENDQLIARGNLSVRQLNRLKTMLKGLNSDLENQGMGDVVRQGSEWFVAEVAEGSKTKHYTWLDADHLNPFPEPVASLLGWLQDFKAQDSIRLKLHELSDVQICPSTNENPLPIIADLNQPVDSFRCGIPRP